MLKSLQILLLGISMLAPMAFGQAGSLGDYDGALQTKFALKISELDEVEAGDAEAGFTLTSASLIREYDLPKTARVYWVFYYDGPNIESGLVVADRLSGEIYSVIAQAKRLTPEDFVEEGVGYDIGMEEWLSARYELLFDIDGLQLSMQALMKFQFIQGKDVSLLKVSSVAGPVGEGSFEDQTLLIITGSSFSASGIVANAE